MKVEVRLFATLGAYRPPDSADPIVLDVPTGATVDDVARHLGIPPDLARVSLVNGQDAGPERRLGPHDVVTFFPPLAGGR